MWWFNTKVALHQHRGGHGGGAGGHGGGKHNVNSNTQATQNACASLCDEIVTLWKLAALNPCISPAERQTLKRRLVDYHYTVIALLEVSLASKENHFDQISSFALWNVVPFPIGTICPTFI